MDAAELKNHVYDIVGALHSVHDGLGPGINEYCYQEALAMELSDRGIPFEREKAFHPLYKGRSMDAEYRIDFLCKGDVIVECKAVSVLTSTHRTQLFNYMRLLKMPCGIIVNFYPSSPPSSDISTMRITARYSPQTGIRSKVGKWARAS